jgi:arginyl-tRNA synthetase
MEKDNPCESILSLIKDYLNALKLNKEILPSVYLEFPSQKQFGDFSVNLALRLSKILKRPPGEVADSIASFLDKRIKGSSLKEDIASVEIAGAGFINFFLTDNYFRRVLKQTLIQGDNFGRSSLGQGQRVLVEFVSANPTGPLSVAHARQAAVGDALCNILEFLGSSVKREYYLNDEGNQIELLGKSIEARFKELQGEKSHLPEGGYEGEYIRDIAKQICKKPVTRAGKPEFFSEYGVKYILKIIKKDLHDFGVSFDSWYSQKKLSKSGKIEDVLGWLKERGFIYERDRALWFKSTAFGDDKDRVVVKGDGLYTYLTPDIAYHKDKYQRGFNWLINLWGPDHHGYVSRLKAAVQAQGEAADSLGIIIVQLATIYRAGRPLQMSTRKGQYITLREILDEVGPEASRFFFLMRRTSAHLDFDLELAKKQTLENPVYYVQYAHARICSIMRNAHFEPRVLGADLGLLQTPGELSLMKRLWRFPRILEICYKNTDPYFLTLYLQELAEDLHRFYEGHRVLTEDRGLTQGRLALICAARIVLRSGLGLLGISAPEKM